MLKNILKLKDAHEIPAIEQKSIQGGTTSTFCAQEKANGCVSTSLSSCSKAGGSYIYLCRCCYF